MKKLLVASALVHLALFGVLARRPAPATPPPAIPSPTAIEEIDVESEPLPTPAPSAAEPAEPSVVAAASTAQRGAPGGVVAPAASAAPATSSGLASEPIAGGNTDWVVNLGPGVAPAFNPATAGGAHNPFVTRQQAEAEARAADGPRKDNSLKGALMAQDAAKGLGPGGPVLRALEEETRASLAPVSGNATFRAIVDAMGNVTALHLLETSGDRAGWDDARARALAALQKKKMSNVGNGAMVDIHVESAMRLPSGAKSLVELNGPLSLGGDLADLGSRPTRVVHARISNVTPL